MSLDRAQTILSKSKEIARKILASTELDDLQKAQLAQDLINAKAVVLEYLSIRPDSLLDSERELYNQVQVEAEGFEKQLQEIVAGIDFAKVEQSLHTFSKGLSDLIKKQQLPN